MIKKLFAGYRIENEETSALFNENPTRIKTDPQLDLLYASLDSNHLRGKLAALGRIVQDGSDGSDGSDGLTIVFPALDLEAVCRIMEPRRRYRKVA